MAQKSITQKNRQAGFTIIEFLIATMVFSFVILICSYAIIHVGRMYYKGMLTNRTQDASRKVVDDVVAAIQFGPKSDRPDSFRRLSGPVTYNGVQVYALCLGDIRFSYAPQAVRASTSGVVDVGGVSLIQSRHVLWRDQMSATTTCTPLDITQANPAGENGIELLGENMRLPEFAVNIPPPGDPWTVRVRVVYGDHPNLFEDTTGFSVCKGAMAGGQFCAVSSFDTSVTKRL